MKRVENRHIHFVPLVEFVDTLCTIITFGDHLHLQLSRLDGIAFSDHRAERAVAAES